MRVFIGGPHSPAQQVLLPLSDRVTVVTGLAHDRKRGNQPPRSTGSSITDISRNIRWTRAQEGRHAQPDCHAKAHLGRGLRTEPRAATGDAAYPVRGLPRTGPTGPPLPPEKRDSAGCRRPGRESHSEAVIPLSRPAVTLVTAVSFTQPNNPRSTTCLPGTSWCSPFSMPT